ncbi:adenine-specific methyltransferase EcoRI family protein [Pseudomarimonas arenosa]|uniref:Modification methylase n=1 Tax=Pseudomarimonas arenosa TaxID=2774145 RepID=A0AAW3ZCQ0_9GAMM|nr:adenine-specific methyltransferase EcoRI family protein [Pseudomarimonas arenosa]MBD8524128.1 hypothetical protein [Pseudomarimonas arenosa]
MRTATPCTPSTPTANKAPLALHRGLSNRKLLAAKQAKNDEFYTRYSDVQKEVAHYTAQFQGKTVYLNCDDPSWSNVYKYFARNFETLGLKCLIATYYIGNGQYQSGARAFCHVLRRDKNGRLFRTKRALKGDGDFRSAECRALLNQADIVVTNPPFSLFREFIALMTANKKDFLVMGPGQQVKAVGIMPLFVRDEIRLGVTHTKTFHDPKGNKCDVHVVWYTNLRHNPRAPLVLTETYGADPARYPRMLNHPTAINVDWVVDIPRDWAGVMGVPISFLEKHCPAQFEVLGHIQPKIADGAGGVTQVYSRLLIKRRPASATPTPDLPPIVTRAVARAQNGNKYQRANAIGFLRNAYESFKAKGPVPQAIVDALQEAYGGVHLNQGRAALPMTSRQRAAERRLQKAKGVRRSKVTTMPGLALAA